jgi:hypothetical protein
MRAPTSYGGLGLSPRAVPDPPQPVIVRIVWTLSAVLKARVPVEDRRIEYNTLRPHSALGWLTPTEYEMLQTTSAA